MQVARLLPGEHERSGAGKLRQALRALQLERKLSKDAILRLYLRLAPFGGNLEGVRAASLAYFGKEPRRLSLAEAALLVALPQSPELRRPDRFPQAARRARNRVLAACRGAGRHPAPTRRARAMAERMPTARREFPMLAPHLADAEVEQNKTRLVHRLTIDAAAQASLEQLAREHAARSAAACPPPLIAVDHRTGEVIAHVGSPGYLDEDRFGAVDMTSAVRSPGSTLKPIIYGLAFEAGLAHPETLIEDRPTRFGVYVPKNFDQDWHGTVTIRMALAQSLNIPAVKVLEALGPRQAVRPPAQAGVTPVLPKGAEPSLAIALGGLGLKLSDLATLYAGLARGGEPVALQYRRDGAEPKAGRASQRLLSPVAAWYVSDILRNAPAPANAKPGQLAYKTGTSYGFRDAWAVGYDGRHTIAVWVGRPDGAATPGLAGRTAAAPLLFDAFARLSRAARAACLRRRPACSRRRHRPAAAAQALPRGAGTRRTLPSAPISSRPCRSPSRPTAPSSRSRTATAPASSSRPRAAPCRSPGSSTACRSPSDPGRREAELPAASRGFLKLSVIDAKGRADRVTIRLK